MNERKLVSSGMSFPSVLTVVFIVLKLVGVINWRWVWVLSPIWITLSIYAVVIMAFIIVWVIAKLWKRTQK
jgi:membrane protein YdbS with pleckstrin-like domain